MIDSIERIKLFGSELAACDHLHDPQVVSEFARFAVGTATAFGVAPEESIRVSAHLAARNHFQGDEVALHADALLRDEWLIGLIYTEILDIKGTIPGLGENS